MNRVTKQFVLVSIAVALGALVLQFGFDSAPSPTEAAPEPEQTATAATAVAPTPTPPGGRDPSTLPVLVTNSTGIGGLAGTVSTQIETELGYLMLTPVDSTGPALDTTAIFAVVGAEGAAQAIAGTLGVNSAGVVGMPASPPVADLAGAEVLVVVGSDLAPSQ